MADDKRSGCMKWAACGCGGCVVLVAALVAFALAVGGLAMFTASKTEPYQEGLRRAQQSPAAVEALGQPIEAGFLVQGSVSVDGDGGAASLRIPVSGPDGKGTVRVEASRSGGRWEYTSVELEVASSGQRVDLAPGFLESP